MISRKIDREIARWWLDDRREGLWGSQNSSGGWVWGTLNNNVVFGEWGYRS